MTPVESHVDRPPNPVPVSGGSPVLSVRNAPVQFDPALGLRSAPVQSDLVPGQRKAPVQAAEKSWRPLQVNLKSFRKNISDLRVQLQQMRQQQVRPGTLTHQNTGFSSRILKYSSSNLLNMQRTVNSKKIK